jgi:hypothetical protein
MGLGQVASGTLRTTANEKAIPVHYAVELKQAQAVRILVDAFSSADRTPADIDVLEASGTVVAEKTKYFEAEGDRLDYVFRAPLPGTYLIRLRHTHGFDKELISYKLSLLSPE